MNSLISLISTARSIWRVTHKGDQNGRALADRHYTRQTPGAPMWTRPGYSYVLIGPGRVFVWWRPKWEDGRRGTARKDGRRVLECTLFRRESGPVASELIRAAVATLFWPEARSALHLNNAGNFDHPNLITAVGVKETSRARHILSLAPAFVTRGGLTINARRPLAGFGWLLT